MPLCGYATVWYGATMWLNECRVTCSGTCSVTVSAVMINSLILIDLNTKEFVCLSNKLQVNVKAGCEKSV